MLATNHLNPLQNQGSVKDQENGVDKYKFVLKVIIVTIHLNTLCIYVFKNEIVIIHDYFHPVTCQSLRIENGEVEYNTSPIIGGYLVETTALFSCNQHYGREGPSSVICEVSGNWNQEAATCHESNENI